MPVLLAASSHHSSGTGSLMLLALLAAVFYVIHNLIWPFRSCRNCQGLGRFRSPSGGSWRYCRTCGGRGAQVRTGRRIWTWWTRIKDRGNR
jgi:hypothetical protein